MMSSEVLRSDGNMITRIARAIAEADTCGRLIEVSGLTGFSGDRLIGCLQRLARINQETGHCYVEVGVFQGLTLVSVSSAARGVATFGIDNFSQFDPLAENRSLVLRHLAANDLANAKLVDEDFEVALVELSQHIGQRRVGTYFVDGPHDYRSQLMCLELMRPYLAADAVIIIDDSNYLGVRQANRDFLTVNPEFKLIFEAYTPCHPKNMNRDQYNAAIRGWWNGVNIIVRDSTSRLQAVFPPVAQDRRIFVNDHIVHSSAIAANSNRAVEIIGNLARLKPFAALLSVAKLWRERREMRGDMRGSYVNANTFSDALPARRFNPAVTSLGLPLA